MPGVAEYAGFAAAAEAIAQSIATQQAQRRQDEVAERDFQNKLKAYDAQLGMQYDWNAKQEERQRPQKDRLARIEYTELVHTRLESAREQLFENLKNLMDSDSWQELTDVQRQEVLAQYEGSNQYLEEQVDNFMADEYYEGYYNGQHTPVFSLFRQAEQAAEGGDGTTTDTPVTVDETTLGDIVGGEWLEGQGGGDDNTPPDPNQPGMRGMAGPSSPQQNPFRTGVLREPRTRPGETRTPMETIFRHLAPDQKQALQERSQGPSMQDALDFANPFNDRTRPFETPQDVSWGDVNPFGEREQFPYPVHRPGPGVSFVPPSGSVYESGQGFEDWQHARQQYGQNTGQGQGFGRLHQERLYNVVSRTGRPVPNPGFLSPEQSAMWDEANNQGLQAFQMARQGNKPQARAPKPQVRQDTLDGSHEPTP